VTGVARRAAGGSAEGRVGVAQVGSLAEEELDHVAAAMQCRRAQGLFKQVPGRHAGGLRRAQLRDLPVEHLAKRHRLEVVREHDGWPTTSRV
jgi:hypothetical protein